MTKLLLPRTLMALSLLYAGVLSFWFVAQPMPALQDFQEWVFQGFAMLEVLRHDPRFTSQFALASFPVPNMLSQLLLEGVSWIAGPFIAAKLLISAYCAGAVWICWRAARRFAAASPVALFILLLAVVGFNSCFWHGYINYQIALLLMLLYLELSEGRSLKLTESKRLDPATIFCFSILLYCCHASVFVAFLLLVLLREWNRTDRWMVLAALSPSVLLFVLYLMRMHAHGQSHAVILPSLLSHLAYKAYTLTKLGPFQNLVIADGASAKRWPLLYRAGVLLNLAFAACLAAALVAGAIALRRRHALHSRLLIYWGALATLFLLLPSDLAEVVNLGERFLVLMVMSLLLTALPRRGQNALAGMCVLGFALTAAQIPAASLSGAAAPEAFHQPPTATGRAYAGDGLFAHRLYQNDGRRIELQNRNSRLQPLLFDTGLLINR